MTRNPLFTPCIEEQEHPYKLLVNDIEEAHARGEKAGAFNSKSAQFDEHISEKLKQGLRNLLADRSGHEDLDPSRLSARQVRPWPQFDWASILREHYPHFEEVITMLERRQALCRLSNIETMSFPPILLAGPPGVGKTQFSLDLAKVMGVPFKKCDMSTQSSGWVLSGLDLTWASSKQGIVFNCLTEGDTFNPIVMLDELDKVNPNPSSLTRADSPLLTLLEPSTAKHFSDNFMDVAIDASGISWIATANDTSKVDEPIASRFRVFNIPVPTFEQRRAVAESVYASILATEEWGSAFQAELNPDVLDALAELEEGARQVKAKLTDALGIAAMQGRNWVELEDLPVHKKVVKRSIGFM